MIVHKTESKGDKSKIILIFELLKVTNKKDITGWTLYNKDSNIAYGSANII